MSFLLLLLLIHRDNHKSDQRLTAGLERIIGDIYKYTT